MKQIACALLLATSFCASTAHADCSTRPTQFTGSEFPSGDFFSNFSNACYTIPLATGNGQNGQGGDLNSVYNEFYYKVDPRYQLIITGSFPNARYFSITAYDSHGAVSQSLLDTNIVPLSSSYINPYQAGAVFVDGQKYAASMDFGGTPGTLQTGCQMNGYNVDVNKLDVTQRHQG